MTRAFFFFNDTATTEIYTLSLHDALPIFLGDDDAQRQTVAAPPVHVGHVAEGAAHDGAGALLRSEEHTSELQSRQYLVCRLLLEKKKKHGQAAHAAQREKAARDGQ